MPAPERSHSQAREAGRGRASRPQRPGSAPRLAGRSGAPRSGTAGGRLGAAVVLALLATAVGAEPTRVLDLATFGTPAGDLTRIYGSAGEGDKGVPVAGGGDLDDDGFSDSAFSAVQASPLGRAGAGEVAVVFGDGTLGGSLTTAGLEAGVLKIAGAAPMEVAGVEIEIADVTGDGVADLLIGRQNYSPVGGSRPGAGGLTILVGGEALRDHAETLQYLDLCENVPTDCASAFPPAAITATTFVGASSYDRLGIWMRAGDVDGDGIEDIVVGADEVDKTVEQLESNRGAAYVIRGGSHLAASQIVDLADFGTASFPAALEGHVALLEPPAGTMDEPVGSTGYHLGATCQIGDLDGNGKGEVILAAALNRANAGLRLAGAPGGTGQATGGAPHGATFIAWDDFFPTAAWASGYTVDLGSASEHLTRIDGSAADPENVSLGEELLGGLDYDGDGHQDLFLGDLAGNGGNGSFSGVGIVLGNVAVLEGMTAAVDDLLATPPEGLRVTVILGPSVVAIGADTAIHGDYDGDGLADLAFCNPKDDPLGRSSAGTVHVIFGEQGGWPAVIDLSPAGLPAPAAVRIVEIRGALGSSGADGGDTLCYSAAGGDLDQDGVPDLLINEMEGNGFTVDGGDDGDELDPIDDVGNLLLIGGKGLLPRVLLDVDGDGEASPLTDGILVLRYLFGFTGTTLTGGALGSGATRSGPEIEQYLALAGAALDADGDDQLGALTDGILVLRYLFGFSGELLTNGVLGAEASRTDPADVASFLAALLPP